MFGGGSDNAHQWLRSLKTSSPPKMSNGSMDAADDHSDWIAHHPSALKSFDDITGAAAGKRVAVFLDYDGTLSPIVDDPDQAVMPEEMRSCVKNVASSFTAAIITGRRRDKVYQFVQLPEVYYAGSHGMDIVGPSKEGGEPVSFQPAKDFLPVMDEVYHELTERAKAIEGSKVEHNKFCITVHFRCVKEESWEPLAEMVHSVLCKYERLTLLKGRKVLEIRPSIDWGKGKALEFFLTALGLDEPLAHSFPIYIGDDRTDEDAFKVLKRLGVGCAILVSAVAKPTSASFSLKDPPEVMEFLSRLVQWKHGHLS